MFPCCRVILKPRESAFGLVRTNSHECHSAIGVKRFSTGPSMVPYKAETGEKYSLEGRKLLQGLMAQNIGLYGEHKNMRNLRWKQMAVGFAPRHAIKWTDLNYFTTTGMPYVEAVCRRYLADNVKPLWWTIKSVGQFKPIVRGKTKSRMNIAFKEALRNAGYDAHGQRLPSRRQPNQSGRVITQLFGSVEIRAHDPIEMDKVPFKELQAHFEKVVRAAEEVLGKTTQDSRRGSAPTAGPRIRQMDSGRSASGNRGNNGGGGGRGGSANKTWDRDSSTRRPLKFESVRRPVSFRDTI